MCKEFVGISKENAANILHVLVSPECLNEQVLQRMNQIDCWRFLCKYIKHNNYLQLTKIYSVHIFSCVWPFYEQAVSHLEP